MIVDAIKAIDIETTTRELYLEDSPEQFILRALDDEGQIRIHIFVNMIQIIYYLLLILLAGNVFSSLVGLSFEWSLLSDTDVEYGSIVDAHNVLR